VRSCTALGPVSLAASLGALIAGCHHADSRVPHGPAVVAAKLPDGAPLVTPGEHMAYRLALRGMELAAYDISVGEVGELAGTPAIVVQSHARAVGLVKAVANVDDTFTSWINVRTGRPLVWNVDEYETRGTRKEKTEVRFVDRTADSLPILFHIDDDPPQPEPQRVSQPETWDFNAFLVALRAWEAPDGTHVGLEVMRSRFMWKIDVTVHGKETLVTELGEMPALRFDGHAVKLRRDGAKDPESDERDFSVWISDDDGRVPLQLVARTDYGDIKMEIVDYQPGTGTRLR
jgi:hypothetical protein